MPNSREMEARKGVDVLLNAGLGVVVLKRGKARLFREDKNPTVFAGAVERCISPPGVSIKGCDPVAVCDGSLSCIGFGFFNPDSMFRVRILRHVQSSRHRDGELDTSVTLPWDWESDIHRRLEEAMLLRETIGLPSSATTTYRIVNGEGDRLSGLVVDRVGNCLVVSSSAIWCERYKEEIRRGLTKIAPGCNDVIWRRNIDRLRQDGFVEEKKVDDVEKLDNDGPLAASTAEIAEEEAPIIVREGGVQYAISRHALTRGQKTGHYADQRENRAFLRHLISQRSSPTRVLDLFCYTGGFGLNAALGGEDVMVVAVDSSGPAISMGSRNAELNSISEKVQFVQSDVVKYLHTVPREEQQSYDVVVLDPPKFAPNAKALPRATHKYRTLNYAAINMVKRGGLLVTCTCSAAMTRDRKLFVDTVRKAAGEHGREITLLKTVGAAADHPIAPEMPESEYLTACVFACR